MSYSILLVFKHFLYGTGSLVKSEIIVLINKLSLTKKSIVSDAFDSVVFENNKNNK